MSLIPRRPFPRVVLSVFALTLVAVAQPCPNASQTFWKRDALPQVPSGLTGVSVVQGLCENEAAGVVFTLPPAMPAQKLTQVVAPWGAAGGVGGFTALLDLEVYDGVTFSGANVTLGTMVFSLSQTAGANMQVSSHGLNALDVSAFNIVVGNAAPTGSPAARRFAVCFRVGLNNHPTGTCATGYPANFFTDNGAAGFFCNSVTTPAQTSIMDITGQGWRDASLATVSGIPLCPFYYAGVWCIRACSENAAPPNPFQVNPLTSLPATAPTTIVLNFVAPGAQGVPYLAAASLTNAPGIPTPYGTIPLTYDGLLAYSLDPVLSAGVFVNFQGVIGSGGSGTGLVNVPYLQGTQFAFYVAFVVIPPVGPWGLSDARLITVN